MSIPTSSATAKKFRKDAGAKKAIFANVFMFCMFLWGQLWNSSSSIKVLYSFFCSTKQIRLLLHFFIFIVTAKDGANDHVFHLHGNSFYIVGMSQMISTLYPPEIVNLDKENKLVKRNLENPIRKDTLTLPSNRIAAVRFKADNPGKG